ncbi:MAG: 16S rRNA (adenine(1518)-N(6)/adenine(1519)-N(6))-dimethyltransferase RsmA [Pyrinomonadaceae bacterium]
MKGTDRHRAKRSLGQNFLVEPAYAARITAAIDASAGDTVIEIGPGHGALTEKLVGAGANVIAIELDAGLCFELSEKFAGRPNFRLIEGDALDVDYVSVALGTVKLAANLPYNISTAILQKLAEHSQNFSVLVLMLQKEVVDRITAKPGSSERGFLTVLVESSFDARKLFDVPPAAFRPRPKVMSSVVQMVPAKNDIPARQGFRRLLSTAFAQKRKTILNNLKVTFPHAANALAEAGIEERRRAESLTLEEWLRLHAIIGGHAG